MALLRSRISSAVIYDALPEKNDDSRIFFRNPFQSSELPRKSTYRVGQYAKHSHWYLMAVVQEFIVLFRFLLTNGNTGGINPAVKPTKALRQFLAKHPDLREWSTQFGLAQIADRSESLLRSVEAGRMEMSPKFARAISNRTGVAFDWLMKTTVDPSDISAADGGQLQYEMVIARIKGEIERNLNQAERDLAAVTKLDSASAAVTSDPVVSLKRRMAAAMAKLVEDAIFESLSRGETLLMDEITRILTRDFPAEKPE